MRRRGIAGLGPRPDPASRSRVGLRRASVGQQHWRQRKSLGSMAGWVFCNRCFQPPQGTACFSLTNCGHVYCDVCLRKGQGGVRALRALGPGPHLDPWAGGGGAEGLPGEGPSAGLEGGERIFGAGGLGGGRGVRGWRGTGREAPVGDSWALACGLGGAGPVGATGRAGSTPAECLSSGTGPPATWGPTSGWSL